MWYGRKGANDKKPNRSSLHSSPTLWPPTSTFFTIPTGSSMGAIEVYWHSLYGSASQSIEQSEEGKKYIWNGKCKVYRTGVSSDWNTLSINCKLICYLNTLVPCETIYPPQNSNVCYHYQVLERVAKGHFWGWSLACFHDSLYYLKLFLTW